MKQVFKTDSDLIQEIKEEKSNDALEELVLRHSGIYIDIINRQLRNFDSSSHVKYDLYSEKEYFIYNCALKYDESRKIKFSTFIGNMAKWKCWDTLSCMNKRENVPVKDLTEDLINNSLTPEYEEIINIQNNTKNIEKEDILSNIKHKVDQYHDERAKQIFYMRYFSDRKLTAWKKISEKLDLSISGCININQKLINHLKKEKINEQRITNRKSD